MHRKGPSAGEVLRECLMVGSIDGKEMLRLGNKADVELYALGLTPGVRSSKKLSLLPGLHQGSILGFHSPPGPPPPTVTTPGCHCVKTVSSRPPSIPPSKFLWNEEFNPSGFHLLRTWGSCLSCPRIPCGSRNAGTLVPRPSVTPGGP